MSDLFPVTLADQIACVKREIEYRDRVYPRLVSTNRMSMELAEREQRRMKAVLETLISLQKIGNDLSAAATSAPEK